MPEDFSIVDDVDAERTRLANELIIAAEKLMMVEPSCWSFHLRHDSRRHEEEELDEFRDAINAVTEAASAINDHDAARDVQGGRTR